MAQRKSGDGKDARLEALLEHLRDARGFDFSGYKRATLQRRIVKRMSEVGVESYEAYVDYLEANPREFAELFNTILINVTGFFRDPEAWDYLQRETIPELIASIPDEEPIRVWSAGCASGEEAYTAAIALLEALGEEQFKRRVKIYATDIDEEALAEARAAVYSEKSLEEMPAQLRERYFVENGRGFGFRPDLRRSVIFGRNELLQDAPISRIDMLICRNVLMYFTVDAQTRILGQLNFALRDRGFLFLGKSEMLVRHSDYFTPVDIKWRVFKRIPRRNFGERLGQVIGDSAIGDDAVARRNATLREAAASIGPTARLIVDSQRFLVDVNQRATELFPIGPADLGRTSSSPTGRSSCGRRSTAPSSRASRSPPAGSNGAGPAKSGSTRSKSPRWSRRANRRWAPRSASPTSPISSASRPNTATPNASSRPPTRSCSRRSRSWRRPTRSCSRPTRSSRPPTRSCSRQTRSCRR
jgi:two-component system, chemotaxis family, CheB/CheR fusion protein